MNSDIDLVYLWVDGNDPRWIEKRNLFLKTDVNLDGRYIDNQELKYSLRSVSKNVPWVRKIFIITDGQVPEFIDQNHEKIQIVDHADIIPVQFLPTYNSVVIEYFIPKISDLSEKFIYMNDDMFINNSLSQSFFFKNGLPITRMIKDPFIKTKLNLKRLIGKSINNYRLSIENAYNLFQKKYDVFYPVKPHHNVDAFLKSDFDAAVEAFSADLNGEFKNRFRSHTDIQRILVQYYSLFKGKSTLHFTDRKESCRIPIQKPDFYKYIDRYQPDLFCLNDTEHATDDDRARIVPFLESLYPEKSPFEL